MFGLDADWEKDTVASKDGWWHNLINSSYIIDLAAFSDSMDPGDAIRAARECLLELHEVKRVYEIMSGAPLSGSGYGDLARAVDEVTSDRNRKD